MCLASVIQPEGLREISPGVSFLGAEAALYKHDRDKDETIIRRGFPTGGFPACRMSNPKLDLWSTSVINSANPRSCPLKNMTAQITSLSELKKELQNNFSELKIDLLPSERRPEWIEVGEETWGETTIRINVHSDCISIFGIVREKSDSYAARPLPAEVQDALYQIRTLLETSNLIVVHGPVTVGWFEP
jgi:hypothetical protein